MDMDIRLSSIRLELVEATLHFMHPANPIALFLAGPRR